MNERLYRSRDDRMLAGVAGGLAEMWDVDPSLVRIVWALLAIFTGGIFLLVYILMAIVVPEEEDVWPATGAPAAPATGWAPPAGTAAATTAAPAGTPAGSEMPVTPGDDTVITPPLTADAAAGAPLVTPPPEPGALWASPPVDPRRASRMEARAARRAARGERRGSGGLTGAMIGGLILVALGFYFLVREWLPAFDFDWFWPAMLIVLGVGLLVIALTRKPGDPGAPPR